MTDKEVAPPNKSLSSQEIRQARVKSLVRRLLIFVALPTFLGIIYYSLVVSSQYESVAIFTVQSNTGGKTSNAKRDALLIKEYALSRAMLSRLIETQKFTEHYQGDDADFLSDLPSGATSEEVYEYYLGKTEIEYLSDSGALRLSLRAFDGKVAQSLSEAILRGAEEMANASSSDAHANRLSLAETLLAEAETMMHTAQSQLSEIEHKNEVQPDGTTTITPQGKAALTSARFKRDLAQKRYEDALEALEATRQANLEAQLYVTTIAPPSLPSGASYPKKLWGMLTVFVLSFVFMGVATMLGAAVREHARF